MQTIGRLVTLALDKHTDTATATLNFAEERTNGKLDNGLHLFLEVAFGNVVDELLDNVQAFENFVETNHVTSERISFGTNHFIELHTVISSIRTKLTEVIVPTGSTTRTTCTAE